MGQVEDHTEPDADERDMHLAVAVCAPRRRVQSTTVKAVPDGVIACFTVYDFVVSDLFIVLSQYLSSSVPRPVHLGASMCGGHQHDLDTEGGPTSKRAAGEESAVGDERQASPDDPPDWENMPLPPDYILAHLTDAHCHPTDLDQKPETYEAVKLGGIAAMGTIPEDQPKVAQLGAERGWKAGSIDRAGSRSARAVACFGYHPWFAHRYTLQPGLTKAEHYMSIFFPPTTPLKPDNARRKRDKEALEALLPFYPDPLPFEPLVQGIKADLEKAKADGRLGMVGEVGLDGGARVLWPKAARHLYDEDRRALRADWREVVKARTEGAHPESGPSTDGEDGDDGWKRLAPFKICMAHQQAILKAQMEVAVQLGVPVSLHCVAAPGPSLDILKEMRDTHGPRFTNRVNVDLHSGGGWSPEYWAQAAKQLSNLYASPSIYITGRNSNPAGLIRAISTDRMLVESDTHDVTRCSRLVWGATEWIARVKGWGLESESTEDWTAESLVQSEEEWIRRHDRRARSQRNAAADRGSDERAGEAEETVWAVKTLERNWARFMGLIEPYE